MLRSPHTGGSSTPSSFPLVGALPPHCTSKRPHATILRGSLDASEPQPPHVYTTGHLYEFMGGTHRVVHVAAVDRGGVAVTLWWICVRAGWELAVVPLLNWDIKLLSDTVVDNQAVEGDHGGSSKQAALCLVLARYVAGGCVCCRFDTRIKVVVLLTDGELHVLPLVLPLNLPRVFSG